MKEKLSELIKDWSFVHGVGSSGLCGGTIEHVEIILTDIKPYIRDMKIDSLFNENFVSMHELRRILHINIKKARFCYLTRINHGPKMPNLDEPYDAVDIIIKNIFGYEVQINFIPLDKNSG